MWTNPAYGSTALVYLWARNGTVIINSSSQNFLQWFCLNIFCICKTKTLLHLQHHTDMNATTYGLCKSVPHFELAILHSQKEQWLFTYLPKTQLYTLPSFSPSHLSSNYPCMRAIPITTTAIPQCFFISTIYFLNWRGNCK